MLKTQAADYVGKIFLHYQILVKHNLKKYEIMYTIKYKLSFCKFTVCAFLRLKNIKVLIYRIDFFIVIDIFQFTV